MSGKRTYPPRLREIQAEQEEKQVQRKRRFFYILIPILALAIAPLLYGLLERNVFRPKVDPRVERTDLRVRPDEHIQINVLNACGADGVAKQVADFLQARQFDVPEYGNSDRREPYSHVIDRVGDSLSALKVAYALGISPTQVRTEIDSSLFLRATVVIGADYRSLRPMQ